MNRDKNVGKIDKVLTIIDTEEFQRLRGIKQLGFADLIYPGAVHTRFVHSLGVMQLGGSFLRQIIDSLDIELSVKDQNVFLAACLLHDVGHAPFSHVLEDFPQVPNHDILSAETVVQGEIKRILENEWCIDPVRVAAVIGSKPVSGPPSEEEERLKRIIKKPSQIDSFFSNVFHSQIGPDKLDYLKRDAFFSGAQHGFHDAERLIGCLEFKTGEESYEMVVTEKGIPLVEHALFSYYQMFRVLYWHHAHRSVTAMARRAVEDAILEKEISEKELLKMTDEKLLFRLRECNVKSSKDLTDRIYRRKLYKRGKTLSMHEKAISDHSDYYRKDLFEKSGLRRNSEKKIVKFINNERAEVGGSTIEDYEVLIDIPNLPKWRLNINFKAENPVEGGEPLDFTEEKISELTQTIGDLFEKSVWKLRIFCSDIELKKYVEEYWDKENKL